MNIKNLWNNDSFLKILSFILACITWFYIMIVYDPVVDKKFRGINVTTTAGQSLEEKGLMIYDLDKIKLTVTARGTRRATSLLNNSSFRATIDVSNISEEGEYSRQTSVYVYDNSVSVIDKQPYEVSVKVVRKITDIRNIEIINTGEVKDGYTLLEETPEYSEIEIIGPVDLVNSVKKVVATSDLSDRSASHTQDIKLKLLDENDNEIVNPNLSKSKDSVKVNFVIIPVKEAGFTAKLVCGDNPELSVTDIVINPEKIQITAEESVLNKIDKIDLGEISVRSGETEITVDLLDLDLPFDVIGEDTIITIKYKISNTQ